eukprot:scaffold1648_cov115-Cylindrotheca_fusiformis.AAC.3
MSTRRISDQNAPRAQIHGYVEYDRHGPIGIWQFLSRFIPIFQSYWSPVDPRGSNVLSDYLWVKAVMLT